MKSECSWLIFGLSLLLIVGLAALVYGIDMLSQAVYVKIEADILSSEDSSTRHVGTIDTATPFGKSCSNIRLFSEDGKDMYHIEGPCYHSCSPNGKYAYSKNIATGEISCGYGKWNTCKMKVSYTHNGVAFERDVFIEVRWCMWPYSHCRKEDHGASLDENTVVDADYTYPEFRGYLGVASGLTILIYTTTRIMQASTTKGCEILLEEDSKRSSSSGLLLW